MDGLFDSVALRSVLAVFAACLLFSCQSPVETRDTTSDDIEFESVWQYLKAFSIHADDPLLNHQNPFPPDPLVFTTMDRLFDAVHDTLSGNIGIVNNYTHYYDESLGKMAATVSAGTTADASGDYTQTVFFDRLTTATACITDTSFETWTWYDFQVCADSIFMHPEIKNVIFDIRHNRGGDLAILDSIVSALVPLGTAYIEASDREFDQKTNEYITTDWHPWVTQEALLPGIGLKNKKFVVIMDDWTASAAEIFASAMYERDSTQNSSARQKLRQGHGPDHSRPPHAAADTDNVPLYPGRQFAHRRISPCRD